MSASGILSVHSKSENLQTGSRRTKYTLRGALSLLGLCGLGYLAIVTFVYFSQESLIFKPMPLAADYKFNIADVEEVRVWSVTGAVGSSTPRGSGAGTVARQFTKRGRFTLASSFNGTGGLRRTYSRYVLPSVASAAAGIPVAQAENR